MDRGFHRARAGRYELLGHASPNRARRLAGQLLSHGASACRNPYRETYDVQSTGARSIPFPVVQWGYANNPMPRGDLPVRILQARSKE